MIRLYLKALRTKSLKEIVSVAQEEHDFLIKNKVCRISPFYSRDFKYYAVLFESLSIINQASTEKKSPNLAEILLSYLANPMICFLYPGSTELKFRCFWSGVLSISPWSTSINLILKNYLNLNPANCELIRIGCGSLYQSLVLIPEKPHKTKFQTLFNILISFSEFYIINYSAFKMSNFIGKKASFIPKTLINAFVSIFYTTPLIRHFANKGFKSLIYSLFFSFAEKMPSETDFDLPEDCDVPNELKCLICYDLIRNPVQCQGQLMCNDCLQEWITNSHCYTNPATGQPFSIDEVSKDYVIDVLTRHYLNYVRNSSKQ